MACGEYMCGDNRFEIIETAKKRLIEATNIESSPDEMKVLDWFLLRIWQMGWLDCIDTPVRQLVESHHKMKDTLAAVKDAFQTDIINAPGSSPSYEAVEKARIVYNAVLDALGVKAEGGSPC